MFGSWKANSAETTEGTLRPTATPTYPRLGRLYLQDWNAGSDGIGCLEVGTHFKNNSN